MNNSDIVWELLYDPVRRFIMRHVKGTYDAEDILQDVFLKAYQNADKLRDISKAPTWVFQIARNSVRDYYRSKMPMENLDNIRKTRDFELESELSGNAEIAACIPKMIADLPQKYRDALVLTAYFGLSQAEMGRRLGLSAAGAKSRVQRARKKLKKVLQDCCSIKMDRCGNVIEFKVKGRNPYCILGC